MPYPKVSARFFSKVVMAASVSWLGADVGAAPQQDGVTLYGVIDLAIEYDRVRQEAVSGPAASQVLNQSFFGMSNGVQSGSRFGLRGVESLGSGVSIDFVLEGGFNPAQGTSSQGGRLFGRQSTIGVSVRDAGQLDVGRQINLASNYFLSIDPFGEGFGQANIGTSFGSTNTTRYGNMLLLQVTPLNGLKVGAGYSFATELAGIYEGGASCITSQSCTAEVTGYNFVSNQNMRALTLGAQYRQGPLDLAFAYDKFYGDAAQQVSSESPSAWVLGGAYDLRIVKLSLAFGRSLNGLINGQNSGTGAAPPSGLTTSSGVSGAVLFLPNAQTSSYMFGVTAPLSLQTKLLASWQMMQPQGVLSANAQFKTQQIYSAALTHQLSARTDVYTYASYGLNYAMVNTAESFVIGVGMRHKF